jgi:hypothetical protein
MNEMRIIIALMIEQYAPLKRRSASTKLQSAISQKAVILMFRAVFWVVLIPDDGGSTHL